MTYGVCYYTNFQQTLGHSRGDVHPFEEGATVIMIDGSECLWLVPNTTEAEARAHLAPYEGEPMAAVTYAMWGNHKYDFCTLWRHYDSVAGMTLSGVEQMRMFFKTDWPTPPKFVGLFEEGQEFSTYQQALRHALLDCQALLEAYRDGKLNSSHRGEINAMIRDCKLLRNREDCPAYSYRKDSE